MVGVWVGMGIYIFSFHNFRYSSTSGLGWFGLEGGVMGWIYIRSFEGSLWLYTLAGTYDMMEEQEDSLLW